MWIVNDKNPATETKEPKKLSVAQLSFLYLTDLYFARNYSVPSGHLYAAHMADIDLEFHQCLIEAMIRAEVVTVSNHLVTLTEKGIALNKRLIAAIL